MRPPQSVSFSQEYNIFHKRVVEEIFYLLWKYGEDQMPGPFKLVPHHTGLNTVIMAYEFDSKWNEWLFSHFSNRFKKRIYLKDRKP